MKQYPKHTSMQSQTLKFRFSLYIALQHVKHTGQHQSENSVNLRYLLIFLLQSSPGRGKFLLSNTQASFQSLCLSFPFRFLVSHHNVDLLHQLLQLSLTGSQEPTAGRERACSYKAGTT